MIRAVAFDLDGTLIDSTEAIVESFECTFAELGEAAPTRERIVGTISVPLEAQFGLLCDLDADEAARVYREHYFRIAPGKTVLLPGARESLERLRDAGIALGVATSKRRSSSEMLLKHLGVRDFFGSCIGPDDVSEPKPHPEAVFKSMEALGADAGSLIFVGDTEFDAKAAAAAGVACLCVTTGYRTRAELEALAPEAVYDSLFEVTNHILGVVEGS